MVPSQLSMWGNQSNGCCVTTEEAFAKAAYSVLNGGTELFVPEETVIAWATVHGVLNGAELQEVMTWMLTGGFTVNGQLYNDGAASAVDYATESVLQAAIAQGPVKIGIDADALPQTAGEQQGWSAFGGTPGQFSNEDHCVCLTGFGPTAWLYQQLGVTPPPGLPAAGYLLFTWSSIGFVDHAWIMSTCGEAWLRTPTTVPGTPPVPVPPGPTPTPTTTIVQEVDEAFAALETQYASQPFLVNLLKQVNVRIDSWLVKYGAGIGRRAGTFPPIVKTLIDAAFGMSIKMYPQYAALLTEAQSIIDGLLS
jgi:hypothetical protein